MMHNFCCDCESVFFPNGEGHYHLMLCCYLILGNLTIHVFLYEYDSQHSLCTSVTLNKCSNADNKVSGISLKYSEIS